MSVWKDSEAIAYDYNNLGIIYKNLNDLDKAEENAQEIT